MIAVMTVVLLCAGVVVELLAVLGVCVMRDAFDRLHCVSLSSYGVLLIGLSILVRQSFSLLGDKALLTGATLVLLGPLVVHTTARCLRVRQYGDWHAQPGELRRGDVHR